MRSVYRLSLVVTASTAAIIPLASCFSSNKGSSGGFDAGSLPDVLLPDVNLPDAGTARYSVGGQVIGLVGSGLALIGDGVEPVTVMPPPTPGMAVPFTFRTLVPTGFPYRVTVQTQPTGPSQKCVVSAGDGNVGRGDVKTIVVNCSTDKFVVGGMAAGVEGPGLVLSDALGNNLTDTLAVGANGPFAFTTAIPSGGKYNVTVAGSPAFPAETCTVTQGTGTVTTGNVSTVSVNCIPNVYNVGGKVVGMTGTGLVLSDNMTDSLSVTANGAFQFMSPVTSGQPFAVAITTQPSGQVCSVSGSSGTVASSDVTTVVVNCNPNTFTVGGQVTNLVGAGLVLEDDTGSVSVGGDGYFSFPTPQANGSTYNVQVASQPSNPSQTCTVTGGSGSIAGANVNSVQVSCATASFTIGGQVSGLGQQCFSGVVDGGVSVASLPLSSPSDLVLKNGADSVTETTNGSFTFQTPVPGGGTYDVTVDTQPSGELCTILGNNGVADANVSGVMVSCQCAYTVSGCVWLAVGATATLENDGGDDLTVGPFTSPGCYPFTFATPIAAGGPYSVTASTPPAGADSCNTVSGTVSTTDVTGVQVTCTYPVTVNVQWSQDTLSNLGSFGSSPCGTVAAHSAQMRVADSDTGAVTPGVNGYTPNDITSEIVTLESLPLGVAYNISVTDSCGGTHSCLMNSDNCCGSGATSASGSVNGPVTLDAFCS